MACELCGRVLKRGVTAHHLIPRTCHSNKWFKRRFTREQLHTTVGLCRDCHRAVHDFIPSEKELGRSYHTVQALQNYPELAKYIEWVRKQK